MSEAQLVTISTLEGKMYHYVPFGLQIMPPAHYHKWQKVTDECAVVIGDHVYCTLVWYDRMLQRLTES